jgi:hypothetical protein
VKFVDVAQNNSKFGNVGFICSLLLPLLFYKVNIFDCIFINILCRFNRALSPIPPLMQPFIQINKYVVA